LSLHLARTMREMEHNRVKYGQWRFFFFIQTGDHRKEQKAINYHLPRKMLYQTWIFPVLPRKTAAGHGSCTALNHVLPHDSHNLNKLPTDYKTRTQINPNKPFVTKLKKYIIFTTNIYIKYILYFVILVHYLISILAKGPGVPRCRYAVAVSQCAPNSSLVISLTKKVRFFTYVMRYEI